VRRLVPLVHLPKMTSSKQITKSSTKPSRSKEMSRTRELLKFTWLIGLATALTIVFLSVIDFPDAAAHAQQAAASLQPSPPPVRPAQPVVDLGDAFAEVAAVVEPSIVFIQAESREPPVTMNEPNSPFEEFFRPNPRRQRPRAGQGSGFIVSEDGYILTNNHVVEGMDRLTVTLNDATVHDATVIGRDPLTDVAVIKIDTDELKPAALGDSDSARVGDWVLAFGSPLNLRFTVTAGIVSARGRLMPGLLAGEWAISDFIQTDAAINPGNSGGPLVNIHGQVVGINSAIASNTGYYSGYGFAIPINLVRRVAEQLIADGKVTRSALGVRIRAADPNDAEYAGLDEVRGVVVESFTGDDSPAKKAGLREGDLIVEVDGQEVEYVAQLQQIIGFKKPGSTVEITVARGGGERTTYAVRLVRASTQSTTLTTARPEPDETEAETVVSRLGISIEPLPQRWVSRLGEETDGLVVTHVDPDGPARTRLLPANTQTGTLDVITHVNGERVLTRSEFDERLAEVPDGGIASLRVVGVRVDRGELVTTPRHVRIRTR
jgi:serine protease Do